MGTDTPPGPSENGDRLDEVTVDGASLPLGTLADLHAGVFDPEAGASLWARVEHEKGARGVFAALDRVRLELTRWLDGPAPEVPRQVVERIVAALRAESASAAAAPSAAAPSREASPSEETVPSESRPADSPVNLVTGPVPLEHRRRPATRRRWMAYSAVGLTAAACAAVAITLVSHTERQPSKTTEARPGLSQMTAPATNAPAAPQDLPAPEGVTGAFPLSGGEITALVGRTPAFGDLEDGARRASCLAGLGFDASTPVLGAQPVNMGGPAILLVLPTERPGELLAVAVRPGCNKADPMRVAQTRIGATPSR